LLPLLASVLLRLRRGQEAQATWRKALDANPPAPRTWFGYAELCLFLGQQEEYRRARRALLKRFDANTEPSVAEPVGRACLLLPAAEDELRQAAALADGAAAAQGSTPGWIYRYYLFARALAEYRRGRLARAISMMRGEASAVMGPAPRLVLAMAQHDQGNKKQARKTLARAVVAFDWSDARADSGDVWIAHILRHEAEALILPNLPAFLRGDYQPLDNDERLALVAVCQFQGRYRAALADKQPVGRLEELNISCRYPAARCAALAGCGLGKDGAKLSEAERTHWRKQARVWLQADLAGWTRTMDRGSRAARDLVRKMIEYWQVDPDLAGLREPEALAKLSADERKSCLALWQEVATMLNRLAKTK
jgi:serine/threonine-protein kinase